LRPESSAGRSSYRCEYSDQNRKLSVKQFLYDWAPPAYDHPSLWRNNKISSIGNTPPPRYFYINDDVAWIGLNFRRQPGLSLNINRTMIEMPVVEGSFTDDELIGICKGLKAVNPKIMDQILTTSFSSLCYSSRHKETASIVPLSYWKYTRQNNWETRSLPVSDFVEYQQVLATRGYFLNSVFAYGTPIQEIEYYYEHQERPGSYIRILIIPHNGIPYPPILGDQTCTMQSTQIGDREVHHTYLYDAVGPHEAIWKEQNYNVLLLVKPAKWTSLTWFKQLIAEIRLPKESVF
jgi:hypothetical protein